MSECFRFIQYTHTIKVADSPYMTLVVYCVCKAKVKQIINKLIDFKVIEY